MTDGTRNASPVGDEPPGRAGGWLAALSVASTLRGRSRRPRSMRSWLIVMSIVSVLSLALMVGLCLVVMDILGRTKDVVATEYARAVRADCPELASTVTTLEKGAPLSMAGAGEVTRRVREIRTTPEGRARCRIVPENPLLPKVDGLPFPR